MKLRYLYMIIAGAIPLMSHAENNIEMMQDGAKNEAIVSQQGNGNRVVINQGGAIPHALKDKNAIHLNPARDKLQKLRREKLGESQSMKIHQHGGGKLEVKSVTGDGKAVTDVTSSPSN